VRTRFLALLLFLSGAGGLVLEVAWFRRMAQVAGATSVAMGAVLAAVIGGMALGAWWIGRRADRSPRPLRLYGLLEAGVAVAALVTPPLLEAAQPAFDALAGPLPRFLLASLLLAPGAVLMGGSLPAVACALRGDERGYLLGRLYAANTLGAVAGTLGAGFLLLPALGLAGTMRCAALFSGTAALGALLSREAPPAPAPPPPASASPARRAIVLYAASGFLGLAAEVAFARSLVLVFGSTTHAFTTMLAMFLLGIGVGGAVGARLARRPEGHLRRLETTVAATAALFSLAALAVYGLPRLYLTGYLAWGGGFDATTLLRFLLSAAVLLPGALGLGIAFPLAAHLATAGSMGAGTGRLYAANTVASIVGSTLAVFLLVPALGPQHAVGAAAVVAAIVAALSRRPVVLALAAVSVLGLLPAPEIARERLLSGVYFVPQAWTTGNAIDERSWEQGVDIPKFVYGREATVAVWRWYDTDSLLIDGKAVATNQVLADDHHLALLGHVPMALHADPQRVLVVGLGMGTTYRAVAMHHPSVLRVVELEEAVVEVARYLGVEPADVVIADARSYLRATDEKFDVITSDPIHPWVRGGGDLYTREYFESCRDRLAPGGLACQWLPVYQMGVADIQAIVRTFCSVFPDAAAWYGGGDLVLVGGEGANVTVPRPMGGEVGAALERLGAVPLQQLLVADRARLVEKAGTGRVLTDDALRLEFSTPRQIDNHDLGPCFAWVRALWLDPPPPYGAMLGAQRSLAEGSYDHAWLMLDRAQKESPGHPYVRRYVGELWLLIADDEVRKGELREASQALKTARGYLPGDIRVTGVEAELALAQGDVAGARVLFEKLLAKAPDSAYLRRRLAALDG